MKPWRFLLVVLLLFLSALYLADAKYVSGRVYVSPGRINEITKFNFGTGTGYINGTLEYVGTNPTGEIFLFMDTKWDSGFHKEGDTCAKVKHSHARFPIGHSGAKIGSGLGIAQGDEPFDSDKKGRKFWHFTWQIKHHVRTYGWYMVIADCTSPAALEFEKNGYKDVDEDKKGKKSQRNRNKYGHRLGYELEFFNEGNDHLSADERWLTEIYILATISLAAGWAYFQRLLSKTFGSTGPRHFVIYFIQVGYFLQMLSWAFEIIHLIVYRYNGSGIWLLDFFSEIIEGFSQTLISFVLLCLGNGWTFSKRKVKSKYDPSIMEVLNNPQLLDIDNPVLLLLIIFMFLTIILQLVNKLYDDSFMKFHDHETYAGMFLIFFRFIFGILFFWSLFSTVNNERRSGAGEGFIHFLYSMMIFGSLWFLAFPLIVLLAALFPHYLRHFLVTSGVLLTQSICLFVLSYQFGSDRSTFAKFSEVQSMGMLPGFSSSRTPTYNKYV